jgi:CRP-like cAMP-binding protein
MAAIRARRPDVSLSRQEKLAWLEKVPLLRQCDAKVLEQVADASGELAFAAGQAIVLQGQVGNGLYIVTSGEVRIVAGEDELARLGPGEFFGELSVIDQQPRNATVYAVGATACLALASWDLIALLEQEPQLAMNLLHELADRLRRADAQLRD